MPYIILQWTWGIIQTLAGLVMFLISMREKHVFYKGAIATFWKRPYGISLGMFVFIPPKARFYNADIYHFSEDEIRGRLLVHEYGHTYQSLNRKRKDNKNGITTLDKEHLIILI